MRAAGTRSTPVETLPDVNLATMRAHHWTHIDNLESILRDGELRAGARPELDVSSPERRESRAAAAVPTGESVSDFVPFALSPDAATWDEVRHGADGPGWSAAARGTRPTDFVVLVVPVAALGEDFVVADGEAAGALTRFGTGPVEGGATARRAAIADPALANIEVLVPGVVAVSSVTLIGVPNDRMRDRVRELLVTVGVAAVRVAVYPPWFKPSEA
ncbi:uncharacterized protein DUF4433 [Frondihabitans australicus]|uniref:Uncharacterized protein DUF4433 n=1 Tax=Frondihabitans australicus TaxID=386892 RepID=A0A495IHQ1_9MICO|nr:uncharacterized protein DUF4433 [Frondihabitans australicus]